MIFTYLYISFTIEFRFPVLFLCFVAPSQDRGYAPQCWLGSRVAHKGIRWPLMGMWTGLWVIDIDNNMHHISSYHINVNDGSMDIKCVFGEYVHVPNGRYIRAYIYNCVYIYNIHIYPRILTVSCYPKTLQNTQFANTGENRSSNAFFHQNESPSIQSLVDENGG